jgi:hypothetical protein
MPALLALIPTKDWLWAGAVILLILVGLHEHHKILAEGIAQQKAADDKATAVLVAASAKQTAELQTKATMAEQAYDKEVNSLTSLPVPSVRLCVYPHVGGSVVPQAGTAQPGAQSAGAGAGNIQSVPSGDPSGGPGVAGPDIGGMLAALAAAADRESATVREFQSR